MFWIEEDAMSAHNTSDPNVVDYSTEVGAACTVAFGRKTYVGKVAACGKKCILFYIKYFLRIYFIF